MGPKFDPTAISYGKMKILRPQLCFFPTKYGIKKLNDIFFYSVYLRAVGGEVGATSALAPKIGPLGLVSYFTEKLT